MDQREYIGDPIETLRAMLDGWQSMIYTILPGIIDSYDPSDNTCSVIPAIRAKYTNKAGVTQSQAPPKLIKCPVIFPASKSFLLTLPIAKDDEVLIVWAQRCIDAWWQQGGLQDPMEFRLHDASDGFVLPGIFSKPNVPSNIDTTNACLRSFDNSAYIQLTPDGKINMKAPGGVHVDGTLTATGEGTFNGSHTVSAHKHGGVQTGSGQTGTPTG